LAEDLKIFKSRDFALAVRRRGGGKKHLGLESADSESV
jgi:hypothetical protein